MSEQLRPENSRRVTLERIESDTWKCTSIDDNSLFYLVDGQECPPCIGCKENIGDPRYWGIPLCEGCVESITERYMERGGNRVEEIIDVYFIGRSGQPYFGKKCKSKPTPPKDLYVVQRPDGAVKIGVSKNVTQRIQDLERSGGHSLKLLCVIEGGGFELEEALHRQFAAQRKIGEWFQLSADQIGELVTVAQERK